MKPAAFQYFRPVSVDEALAILDRCQPEAKILAGGQSLVPLMNFRQARPKYLIDINRIEDLKYIRESADAVCIGAMVRQTEIEKSALIAAKCPILAEATRYIGYRAVRNRGTIGGSLAHADPSAEYPTVLLAVNGEVTVRGLRGTRSIGAEELFVGTCRTALQPDEILTEVRLPFLAGNQQWSYLEISRGYNTSATVGVAVLITFDEKKRCAAARIAVAGVGATPLRCRESEDLLSGKQPSAALIRQAAAASEAVLQPSDELHAPAVYKRAMAKVYIERAVTAAVRSGRLA
jgi:CO/xanthine dehydrogenase FAD-binding subunit